MECLQAPLRTPSSPGRYQFIMFSPQTALGYLQREPVRRLLLGCLTSKGQHQESLWFLQGLYPERKNITGFVSQNRILVPLRPVWFSKRLTSTSVLFICEPPPPLPIPLGRGKLQEICLKEAFYQRELEMPVNYFFGWFQEDLLSTK